MVSIIKAYKLIFEKETTPRTKGRPNADKAYIWYTRNGYNYAGLLKLSKSHSQIHHATHQEYHLNLDEYIDQVIVLNDINYKVVPIYYKSHKLLENNTVSIYFEDGLVVTFKLLSKCSSLSETNPQFLFEKVPIVAVMVIMEVNVSESIVAQA